MITASYLLNARMKSVLSTRFPGEIEFHPGDWVPEGTDSPFATYKVIQGLDYEQPYIHNDRLTVRLYHTDFDILQKMIGFIIIDLNTESPYSLSIYNSALVAGVKFLDISARMTANDHNAFIEATEYYYGVIDILHEYVETGQLLPNQSLYIGGS